MAEIRWTEKASQHLESIFEYIAHDSKFYAARFIKTLIKSTEVLKEQPLSGRIVPETKDDSIREVLYKNYRIVYRIFENDVVKILAVYHGAQNIDAMEIKN